MPAFLFLRKLFMIAATATVAIATAVDSISRYLFSVCNASQSKHLAS
jgi:hypothetical protein